MKHIFLSTFLAVFGFKLVVPARSKVAGSKLDTSYISWAWMSNETHHKAGVVLLKSLAYRSYESKSNLEIR